MAKRRRHQRKFRKNPSTQTLLIAGGVLVAGVAAYMFWPKSAAAAPVTPPVVPPIVPPVVPPIVPPVVPPIVPPVVPPGPSPECQAASLAFQNLFVTEAVRARSCSLNPTEDNQDCVVLYGMASSLVKDVKTKCGVTPAMPSWMPNLLGAPSVSGYRMV